MAYTLQDFCAEIHGILRDGNDAAGRETVRRRMEDLLANPTFVETFCGPDKRPGVYTLNEDPTTGACVLAHVYAKGSVSPPHDHGVSWAIYGQAAGYTDMTEYRRTDDGADPAHAALEATKTYRLEPGEVGLYDVGAIHSIDFPDNARFVRVTGVDLDAIDRTAYDLRTGAVKTIRTESADSA